MMCIEFRPGFSQCQGTKPFPVQIETSGQVSVEGQTLSSDVTFNDGGDLYWTFVTQPDSFGLVYQVELSEYYTTVSVQFEGELRRSYQGYCGLEE